jgi:hypothetical protein
MHGPVKLLRGWEYLTDAGTIELLSAGKALMKKAHAAGRGVLIELDGQSVVVEPDGAQRVLRNSESQSPCYPVLEIRT